MSAYMRLSDNTIFAIYLGFNKHSIYLGFGNFRHLTFKTFNSYVRLLTANNKIILSIRKKEEERKKKRPFHPFHREITNQPSTFSPHPKKYHPPSEDSRVSQVYQLYGFLKETSPKCLDESGKATGDLRGNSETITCQMDGQSDFDLYVFRYKRIT